jgi:glutathione S-transferase
VRRLVIEMKLYWSSRSPFVRKVMVAAHEVGLAGRIRTERVVVSAAAPNAEVMAVNPLNKIPTLVLDDGTALYDSRVICEYLDTLHAGPKLFPAGASARWTALRRHALGDGLMEVIVLRLGEQGRAPAMQSEKHLSAYRLKITTALDCLEGEADALAGPPGIGHIAIGCALGHLDFRFAADDWRAGRSKLARWYGDFARRPSMTATEYVDTY